MVFAAYFGEGRGWEKPSVWVMRSLTEVAGVTSRSCGSGGGGLRVESFLGEVTLGVWEVLAR